MVTSDIPCAVTLAISVSFKILLNLLVVTVLTFFRENLLELWLTPEGRQLSLVTKKKITTSHLENGKLRLNVNRACTNSVWYYQFTYSLPKLLSSPSIEYQTMNLLQSYLMVFALDPPFLFLSKPRGLSCYMIKRSSFSELENVTGCPDISWCNFRRCFFT